MATPQKKDHFHGQTALRHLAEVQASGISASLEIHGAEAPGPLFAFLDAARESADGELHSAAEIRAIHPRNE